MTMLNRIRRKRFGEIIVSEGLISRDQLDEALDLQRTSGEFLGTILLDLGYITEGDIVKTLSVQHQLPFLRPSLYELDRKLILKFKPDFLHLHKMLPVDQIGDLLLLVVTDIPCDEVLGQVQQTCQSNLAIYIGSIHEVDRLLKDMVPLTPDQEEEIRRLRRGGIASTTPELVEASSDFMDDTGEKKEAVYTMDTSWESIFDEAEDKLKGGK